MTGPDLGFLAAAHRVALEQVLADLHDEFGHDLVGVLLAGSAVTGTMRPESDLDLYVLIRPLWRRRRTTYVDGVEVEMFINPPQRIVAEIEDPEPSTTHMFATGVALHDPEGMVAALRAQARATLERGPDAPGPIPALLHRYFPVDVLKDIRDAAGSGDGATAALLIGTAVQAAVEAHYGHLRRRVPKASYLLDDLGDVVPGLAAAARGALDPESSLAARIAALEDLVAGALEPLGGSLGEWQTPRQAVNEDGSLGGLLD